MWDENTIWGKIPRFRGEISDFRTKNKQIMRQQMTL